MNQQKKYISKWLKPSAPIATATITPDIMDQFIVKDLEWAVRTLAYKKVPVINNDVVVNNENGDIEDIPNDFGPRAKYLIMSLRKKQAYVVERITIFQAIWRMHIIKKWFMMVIVETSSLIDDTGGSNGYSHINKLILSRIRKVLVLEKYSTNTLSSIQTAAASLYSQINRSTVLIQAFFRGRRIRFLFHLTRKVIRTIQARVRGFFTCQKVLNILWNRYDVYRKQILHLWQHCCTPLSYRSKFWILVDKKTFVTFSLVQKELRRLWEDLDITFELPKKDNDVDDITINHDDSRNFELRLSSHEFNHYLQVSLQFFSSKIKKNFRLIYDFFPLGNSVRWSQSLKSLLML